MYAKNLTECVRLRLNDNDMQFLTSLSSERGCSVSELIRSILGEYRRSLDTIKTLQRALEIAKQGDVHGDTETDINNKL